MTIIKPKQTVIQTTASSDSANTFNLPISVKRHNKKSGSNTTFKIGTRGSPLAMAQATHVKELLEKQAQIAGIKIQLEIIPIQTSGDKFLETSLQKIGGKGLFTKEIEEALLQKKIDIAVHSMKDVPVNHQKGLTLLAILERENPHDAFISHKYQSIKDLPIAAHIGTASVRRTSQLRSMRPDLRISLLRGNVQTRLKKLKSQNFDGTLLAVAGLKRLSMTSIITQTLDMQYFLCAPAQGAIGIEGHVDMDQEHRALIDMLNHSPTSNCIKAERAFLEALDGNCSMPIAAYAQLDDTGMILSLTGQLLSQSGLKSIKRSVTGKAHQSKNIGKSLGKKIKKEFFGA